MPRTLAILLSLICANAKPQSRILGTGSSKALDSQNVKCGDDSFDCIALRWKERCSQSVNEEECGKIISILESMAKILAELYKQFRPTAQAMQHTRSLANDVTDVTQINKELCACLQEPAPEVPKDSFYVKARDTISSSLESIQGVLSKFTTIVRDNEPSLDTIRFFATMCAGLNAIVGESPDSVMAAIRKIAVISIKSNVQGYILAFMIDPLFRYLDKLDERQRHADAFVRTGHRRSLVIT
ncbi:hypothetical protein ABG067_000687 [Albugo candida]